MLVNTDGYIRKGLPTKVTVATAPVISSISVLSNNGTLGGLGNTQGGDLLSIVGFHLVEQSEISTTIVRVFTGAYSCTVIPPVLATLIRCEIQAGSGQGLPVVVQSVVHLTDRRRWISALLMDNISQFSYTYSSPSLSPNSLRLQPADDQPLGDIVGTRLEGDVLGISGTNFGNNASVVSVIYENENSRLFCSVLTVNHTFLTCKTSLGKGDNFRISVIVDGLVSKFTETNRFHYPARPNILAIVGKNYTVTVFFGSFHH